MYKNIDVRNLILLLEYCSNSMLYGAASRLVVQEVYSTLVVATE